jgi:tetratricopeptide (TPR) repeat protein
VIRGEEAPATVTLVIAWGTRESGRMDLVKDEGKVWKIQKWAEFRVLGHEHLASAENWRNARNFGAAVAEYQAALAENPQDSAIVTSLGICYQFMGKPNDAEAQYKKAIEMHPNAVWDPYINLGYIYANRGDIAQAEDSFQRAIKSRALK